jgi:hypothetical protein
LRGTPGSPAPARPPPGSPPLLLARLRLRQHCLLPLRHLRLRRRRHLLRLVLRQQYLPMEPGALGLDLTQSSGHHLGRASQPVSRWNFAGCEPGPRPRFSYRHLGPPRHCEVKGARTSQSRASAGLLRVHIWASVGRADPRQGLRVTVKGLQGDLRVRALPPSLSQPTNYY